MIVADSKGRERERHQIVYGAKLKLKAGSPERESGRGVRQGPETDARKYCCSAR